MSETGILKTKRRDEFDELARAISRGVPRITATWDDERVWTGELVAEEKAERVIAQYFRKLFARVRRSLCSLRTAKEIEGKSQDEIREIFARKLRQVRSRQPEFIL